MHIESTPAGIGPGHFSRLARITILALLAALLNGCSVYMAAHQPEKKNLEVLKAGTPRSLVLAEIGQPRATETRDGKRVDVFSFVQGYSKGNKTGRAVFHGAADVLTIGLWEVVGTPAEAAFDGKKLAFEVTYDGDNRVEKVVQLIGKEDGEDAQTAETLPEESGQATPEGEAAPAMSQK